MQEMLPFSSIWNVLEEQETGLTRLVNQWLFERSPHTRSAYMHDMQMFVQFVGTTSFETIIRDQMIEFAMSLQGSPNSRKRTISSVKSFFSYLHAAGLIPVNVGAAVRVPKVQRNLNQRIIDEYLVLKMIDMEPDRRNHCLLRLLYSSGVRVSELCNLQWKDVEARPGGGQINVLGKGEKLRSIPLSSGTWQELQLLREESAQAADYVFQSRTRYWKGEKRSGRLDRTMVLKIVREAARRVGIENWRKISPHWLRHCHASHALDNGATLPEIRDTLGHSSIAITDIYQHIHPDKSSSHKLKV